MTPDSDQDCGVTVYPNEERSSPLIVVQAPSEAPRTTANKQQKKKSKPPQATGKLSPEFVSVSCGKTDDEMFCSKI